VVGAVVCAQCGKLSESALAQIIQRNWSGVNRDRARNVRDYSQSDTISAAKLLIGSSDPSVRAALASNCRAHKLIVRQVLKDPDPEVRRLAQDTLEGDTDHLVQGLGKNPCGRLALVKRILAVGTPARSYGGHLVTVCDHGAELLTKVIGSGRLMTTCILGEEAGK